MKGILYLEDGTLYTGIGIGKKGTSVGELVFNTSMTGYQEILTDPSYAGQIITMTYPLIGNYGVNSFEKESNYVYARGFVVKNICENPSNYMSEKTIDEMLKEMGIVGISGVDTRSITKKIRNCGALKCVITNEELSEEELKLHLKNLQQREDWMKEVGTREIIHIPGEGHRVVLVDFGVKRNIVRNLMARNCDITIVPYNITFEEIERINPDGILLSNGPGDPKEATEAIEMVKKTMLKYPIFGICLGHQILGLAVGGDTYKLKYGHRGGNHGVKDLDLDRVFITSQNHGFAVDEESIKDKDMIVTHINLNDNTVEGMRHKTLPVFSVQFHPEGAPGPQDSAYLFDKFINSMKGE
ncbi:carbamoyl phosphate synthase small subunit [Fervidicella metallireducens AeB]|uniref:Carbamoyl phosphate synthase small chain n=1 Tax=Fervidicella metallireducens AeB TaxID=1403537 RepID=A0A017RUD5_9CLOT|nr:glutamine-hydrolyzing carbamoyl-phosphate synthase small subunit [Fervidicella metallireducens]EYE88221.1 carbamoyl phosphate synthase small subunit [Fervidicella metallireducens AeB]